MKSYTDLEQSCKLAEILPLESADMWYPGEDGDDIECGFGDVQQELYTDYGDGHPCWSLAALLSVLSKSAYFINEAGIVELSSIKATKWCVSILNCGKIENCYADNPVDACYEMILKLNKLKML